METVLRVLQIVSAVAFVALMAVQTDRAEQSGVMGLGGQGGRMSGAIDMPVGAERILKPLTKWVVVAFLIISALASMEHLMAKDGGVTIVHLAGGLALYLVIMLLGNRIWDGIVRIFGAQNN